ncbi:MAG TPA: beta-propeller fold lactonase family protein [Methylomirabilota bacterium]
MTTFTSLAGGIMLMALMAFTGAAHAATFVYVSNAEDGDIGGYALMPDGRLQPGTRVEAGKPVMPMSVSPDRRFLFAAVRSKPFRVITYAIDPKSGALSKRSSAALAESFPYIRVDRTGRFLLGASYGANLVSVNAIAKDGTVSDPKQVIPTARNAHSIITDNTNRFVFVPHLGTDQIFQFRFDAKTGRLTANTPPVVQLRAGSGPRHIIMSSDNRFAYLLNELTATVTTLSLDAKTGLLTEVGSASALPPDTKLVPGAPRPSPGRSVDNDIWASDLHLTPDGKFLYAAERTGSSLATLGVDGPTGKLTYLSSTPTESQPRGFAIDPRGRTLIVSGEKSDTISVYAIDPATGALSLREKYPTGKGSNWVEIVSFD